MRGRKFFVFLLLGVILSLPALSPRFRNWVRLEVRGSFAPVQNLLSGGEGVGALTESLFQPSALIERTRRLEEQVANLKVELNAQSGLAGENARLRKELGLRERMPGRLLLCHVTSRGDVSGWWKTLTIDRGSAHGLRANLPVITPDGVVGRTQKVTAYNAGVLLLTDPTFRLSCRSDQSGVLGIVQGQGAGFGGETALEGNFSLNPCRLELVSRRIPLAEGEILVTSGLGGVFPEGLVVGVVERPKLDETRLFQTAMVRPAVPMDDVERIFVLLDLPDSPTRSGADDEGGTP